MISKSWNLRGHVRLLEGMYIHCTTTIWCVYIYIYSWCMNILRIYIYKYNIVGLTVERSVYPNWKFHRGGQRLPHDVTIIGSRCHFEPTSTVEHHKGFCCHCSIDWFSSFIFNFLVVFVVPKEFSHHVHHEAEDLSFQLVLATPLVFASWCASPGLLVISSVRKVEKMCIYLFLWMITILQVILWTHLLSIYLMMMLSFTCCFF